MAEKYSISLKRLVDEFNLKPLYLPEENDDILISTTEVNRPGLHLAGFYTYFEPMRIQILGNMEMAFLNSLDELQRARTIDNLFAQKIPCVIITRGLEPFPEMLKSAKEHAIPLLSTPDSTSAFMSNVISFLSTELAPRITRHGVLIEVYGEGMLILGESGVGKSETAIELVKRGHRLIADDAVEIRRVSGKTLVGSSPENIRHFVELRGIGIINARRLFGIGAVKVTEKIDMIIKLELWDPQKIYDRMGIENETTDILGLKVPSVTIPVKPGRNLAIILEVAAMNNRQKKMGYNAAKELLERLGMGSDFPVKEKTNWDLY